MNPKSKYTTSKPQNTYKNVTFDLTPLIDLALATGDKQWFKQLVHRNKFYWKKQRESINRHLKK